MACLSRQYLQQLELPLDATGYELIRTSSRRFIRRLADARLLNDWPTHWQRSPEGVMTFNDTLSETSTDNVFEIPGLNASFDRGRFTLEPMHIIGASATEEGSQRVQTLNGEVSGELDLLKTEQHSLSVPFPTHATKSQESLTKLNILRLITANKKAPLLRKWRF